MAVDRGGCSTGRGPSAGSADESDRLPAGTPPRRRGRAGDNIRQGRGGLSRRGVFRVLTLVPAMVPLGAFATAPDDQLVQAMRAATKGGAVREGRVTVSMPELAENGNSVPLTVTVDSPMTAADHVRNLHILSEKNPVAGVVRFRLGPRSGRARVQTNVRVATSQKIVALAEMSDGSFWSGAAEVVVTITACLDAG